MKRKLTALLLAVAALTALLGTMLAGSQIARAAVLDLLDTTVADFNLGTLYHTELNYNDDGSVALQSIGLAGGWNDTTTTGLPPRIYHASTHVGSHIYVFGGSNGTDTLATAYVTDILANHQLSSWRPVTSLPEPLSGSAAVAVGNTVYVIGGFSGNTFLSSPRVYRATVNPADGSLSAWTQDAQSLEIGLSSFGATVVNGYIMVVGGARNGGLYSPRVYYNHPGAGGALGAWGRTLDLPGDYANGVTGHIVTSYDNKLFVATGLTAGGAAVPDVYSATVNGDGTVSSWLQNTNYGRNLIYTAGTAYGTSRCGGNLYFSGGVTNQGGSLTDYVATALLSPPPDYFAGGWYDTSNLVVARQGHTMLASDDGWLYVIDGGDATGAPISSIRFGFRAWAAAGGATRAPDGQFQSRVLDLRQPTTIYSMSWNTSLAPGQPLTLTLSYRTSNDPAFPGIPFSNTISVASGISQTGQVSIEGTARYLQYSVNMQRCDTALQQTPYLNWVKVTYEGNPIPPTATATALPSPTPGASGINLVASQLEMLGPYGHRISRQYPVTFNVTVRNEGTTAAPAGSPIEADVFTGLSRPPQPGDQSATFGRVVLPQPLAPGQQVVVTMPWQPTAAGTLTLYAWVNRNNLVPETLYTDNVLGPNTSCVYATDGQSFTDVPLTVYFYTPVEYLACQGVISGYTNGDGTFSFRPYNNTTRGQFSKMISLASGWTLVNPTTPTFRDVAPTSTFYTFIETAYSHGVISGYACGAGCLEFRPGANITRGQLAKIVALSKGWTLVSPPTATFRDVAVGSAFYAFVETVYSKNVVSGYACGTGCLEFRPGANGTRGQLSKMIYNAITQR